MGVVFLARDSALDRPVALKLLPPYLAAQPELRERFVQEARVVARLSHPNIVTVYAAEQLGDLVYFAMAYIRGETLTQRVERAGPIPPAQATRMLQELAWGLGYAHANGVVHRDVKPDNILIEQASGRAMLADFGVAYAADASRQTAAGQLIGTPHYVSPEQAYGNPLDGRSDLYSLGASAFFALTGRTLFDAPSPYAVITKHLNEPPPSLATVRPDLPRQLAVAVDRCLAKDPEQRFPSGEALAEALAATGLTEHEVPAPIRHYFRQGRGIALAWLTVAALALWFGRWLEIPPDPVSRGAAVVLFLIAVLWPLAFLLRTARKVLQTGLTFPEVRRAAVLEARVPRKRPRRCTAGMSRPSCPKPRRTGSGCSRGRSENWCFGWRESGFMRLRPLPSPTANRRSESWKPERWRSSISSPPSSRSGSTSFPMWARSSAAGSRSCGTSRVTKESWPR